MFSTKRKKKKREVNKSVSVARIKNQKTAFRLTVKQDYEFSGKVIIKTRRITFSFVFSQFNSFV